MLAGMRRTMTSLQQTKDQLEIALFVAATDALSSEEESGNILGRPHSSIPTNLRRLRVKLGHPKKS